MNDKAASVEGKPDICTVCHKPLEWPDANDPYYSGATMFVSKCRHSIAKIPREQPTPSQGSGEREFEQWWDETTSHWVRPLDSTDLYAQSMARKAWQAALAANAASKLWVTHIDEVPDITTGSDACELSEEIAPAEVVVMWDALKKKYLELKAANAAEYEGGLEDAAVFIENGSFLHDESPAKRFANEVVPKIRALKSREK